jgi:tetratricopeptide (TPR) repeat protein
LRAGFIWDDDDYVVLNPLLEEPGGLAEIWNPSSDRNPQYYPLVFTTFRIERAIWGLHPAGYHAVNVALHAANAMLLLLLLRRIGFAPAFLAAALFAVHPVHVETVAWVTERKNVLSALFYLLSFLAWLRHDRSGRIGPYAASLVCFAAALLSKTVTASLPIAIALALWWRGDRLTARRVGGLIPMLVAGFAMGLVTRAHEARHVLGGADVFAHLGWLDRALGAARALWFYPRTILWPRDLAFFYERWDVSAARLADWLPAAAAAALAAGLVLGLRRGRVPRGAVAAVAFYAVTIFPALGFVDVAPLRFAPVANHFQYLASLGILLLAAEAARRLAVLWSVPPAGQAAAGAAVVLLLAGLAFREARHFRDPGTLWARTAALSPGNAMVLNSYGSWLRAEQRHDEAAAHFERALASAAADGEDALIALTNLAGVRLAQGRLPEALELARRAGKIRPQHPAVLHVEGRILWQMGRLDEAERALSTLLAIRPEQMSTRAAWDVRRRIDDAGVLTVLGHIRREKGRPDEAEELFRRAIEVDADELGAYLSLEALYHSERRFAEGEAIMLEAVERHPRSATALVQLARARAALDRTDLALAGLEEALAIDPGHAGAYRELVDLDLRLGRRAEAQQVLRAALLRGVGGREFTLRLVWELATAPAAEHRDGREAQRLAREFLEDPAAPPSDLSIAAAAQAEAGDFAGALETVRRAAASERVSAPLRLRLRQQELDYEAGRPTRSPL